MALRHRNNPPHKTPFANVGQWRYQALLYLLVPVLVVFTAWQALRYSDLRYLKQRLGFSNFKSLPKNPVWLHAASVGEVIAAQPLVEQLLRCYAPSPVLITTVTPTGAAMVKQRFQEKVVHVYLPIDWRFAINKLLARLTPRCALIMETEIWPNLYRGCANNNVPLITINGRLSKRTLQTRNWIKQLYRHTLQYSSAILSRSEQDTKAFAALGADTMKIKTIGNLKFSAAMSPAATGAHPLQNRPYIVAASTHNNEEALLAQLWHKDLFPDHLLVIAPRHPQRLSAISKQLEPITPSVAVRSKGDTVNQQTQIYLADTLGELTTFMQFADIVIMGGSFIPHGGHNILEPALLGKAIVFGPYMHNFDDEAQQFLNQEAAIQTQDMKELELILKDLINDPHKRQNLGERAKRLVELKRGVVDDYMKEILRHVPA